MLVLTFLWRLLGLLIRLTRSAASTDSYACNLVAHVLRRIRLTIILGLRLRLDNFLGVVGPRLLHGIPCGLFFRVALHSGCLCWFLLFLFAVFRVTLVVC